MGVHSWGGSRHSSLDAHLSTRPASTLQRLRLLRRLTATPPLQFPQSSSLRALPSRGHTRHRQRWSRMDRERVATVTDFQSRIYRRAASQLVIAELCRNRVVFFSRTSSSSSCLCNFGGCSWSAEQVCPCPRGGGGGGGGEELARDRVSERRYFRSRNHRRRRRRYGFIFPVRRRRSLRSRSVERYATPCRPGATWYEVYSY